MNDEKDFPKGKSKIRIRHVSENPWDFGFAKNCRILTAFGFEF